GAGGAGHEDETVLLLGHLAERVRQLELLEGGDPGLQLPQHAGEVTALREDVEAESRLASQPVGAVARPLLDQELAEPAIAVDQVEREDLRLERRDALDRRRSRNDAEVAPGTDTVKGVGLDH